MITKLARMRVISVEIVSIVLVMLSCGSECKPQTVDTSGISDQDLLGLINGNAPTSNTGTGGSCPHKCVPFALCCDQQRTPPSTDGSPTGAFDSRTVIDLGNKQNSLCEGLNLCCQRECSGNTPRPGPTTPNTNQCGKRNALGDRITIIGFEDSQTQLGEFPWMVALLTQGNEYVAGASLVHPRVILTAAHKVHDKTGISMVARIGDWDLADTSELTPPQNINVEKVVIHPGFDVVNHYNNLALLILQRNADLSDTVMPICLPQPGQVFDGATCVATGWGKDVFGATGNYQTIMKKATVPAINHSECQRMLHSCCSNRLGAGFTLHNTLNCAGGNGEDTCEGDGGSPLACPNPSNPSQYIQMGVVSWGIGCGTVGNPGVYGSIPQNVNWITQTIDSEVGSVDFDVRHFVQG